MLNYISAEWYKLCRTKGIFLAFVFLLFMIGLIFFPTFWHAIPTIPMYIAAYLAFLILGFFLAPIFAIRAFDDQYGRGTLKNEVVFGIPRSRSYLGKMLFGGLVGTAAAFLVMGFYILLCLLSSHIWEADTGLWLDLCVKGTLLVLPLWWASMSLAFCLQAVFRNSAGATAVNYLFLLFSVPISMAGFYEKTDSPILNFFNYWFFVAPYRITYSVMDGAWTSAGGMAYSWLVGIAWIVGTSAVGLFAFNLKELH